MKWICQHFTCILIIMALIIVAIPKHSIAASSDNYILSEVVIGGSGGETLLSQKYYGLLSISEALSSIDMESANYKASFGFLAVACPAIEASIDIDPDTLNLLSLGQWVTCYIHLPEGYQTELFEPSVVALIKVNGNALAPFIFPDQAHHIETVNDGEWKVKFDRSQLQDVVPLGDQVELTVTGTFTNGSSFKGTATIRVISSEI